jgi:hypothetical protein
MKLIGCFANHTILLESPPEHPGIGIVTSEFLLAFRISITHRNV